jgi:hypothetical protein
MRKNRLKVDMMNQGFIIIVGDELVVGELPHTEVVRLSGRTALISLLKHRNFLPNFL